MIRPHDEGPEGMARLDTGWHAHPKLLKLGLAAMGLHAWSISYCDATRSDGFIPTGAWPALPGVNQARARLEGAGVWMVVPGGYYLHDYTDWNRTRAQIAEISAAMRANGQAGGQASARAKAQARAKANSQAKAQAKSTPYPGDGVNYAAAAGVTPEGGLGETNGNGGGDFFDSYPDEVRARLRQPPLHDAHR